MNRFWKIAIYIGLPFSIFGTISCICVLFSRPNELDFDYTGVIVGILSLLVTILLGWNIWNVIESKGYVKKVQRELNYAHNKMDYDFGLIYGYFSQMLAMSISNLEKSALKAIMLEYTINSLKILSKMPNTSIEINSITATVANVMESTKTITLRRENAQRILERLGEIENRENIKELNVIRRELLPYISNESK